MSSTGVRCWDKWEYVRIMVPTFLNMFSSAFSITMLFPFLPFMVEFLLPQIDPSSIGNYAGIVASSMFFGRFCGSYIWGALADVWGRKPILIISQLLLGISSLAFGFSVTFPMAVVLRFFVGLSNGVVSINKTIASESSTNKTQALSMSILASSWGVGFIMGPAISGAIADPVGQYDLNVTNSAVNWFLLTFPYSLPGIVNFICSIVAIVISICLLPETKSKRKHKQAALEEEDAVEMVAVAASSDVAADATRHIEGEGAETEETSLAFNTDLHVDDGNENKERDNDSQQTMVSHDEELPLIAEEPETDTNNDDDVTQHHDDNGDEEQETIYVTQSSKRRDSFILSIIPRRRNSASLQFIKMHRPLRRQQTNREMDEEEAVSSDQMELLVEEDREEDERALGALCSLPGLKNRLIMFKKSMLKSLKMLKEFFKDPLTRLTLIVYCSYSFVIIGFDEVYSLWCAMPSYLGGLSFSLNEIGLSLSIVGGLLLPFTLFFFPVLERRFGSVRSFQMMVILQMFLTILLPNLHLLVPVKPSLVLWVFLCLVMLFIRIAMCVNFAATSLFLNNSVTFDKLGSFNGLSISLTSAARCVAPLFAGSIFSASLSEKNQSLGFPLDYHLIFVLFGILLLIVLLIASRLPHSINNQKIDSTIAPSTAST